jgi:hypothetical protein
VPPGVNVPPGWTTDKKEVVSGHNASTIYVSPDGRRFSVKAKAEKYHGRKFSDYASSERKRSKEAVLFRTKTRPMEPTDGDIDSAFKEILSQMQEEERKLGWEVTASGSWSYRKKD